MNPGVRDPGAGRRLYCPSRAFTSTISPTTLTSYACTSSSAGPRTTAPVAQSNRAPCQAHSMVPSGNTSPADRGIAWWVHSSRRALTSSPLRIRQTRSPDFSTTDKHPRSGMSIIRNASDIRPGWRRLTVALFGISRRMELRAVWHHAQFGSMRSSAVGATCRSTLLEVHAMPSSRTSPGSETAPRRQRPAGSLTTCPA
jgi:hypothetical protein